MSNHTGWNDKSRDDLRNRLRSVILGELRLAKQTREEILNTCQEVHLTDDCPENEHPTFMQFASGELDRTQALLASEQATWPKQTDCDRLDRVEADLRNKGIVLWQASPCCDTCTCGELEDRIELIADRHPTFRMPARGFAFFIDQTLPESLAESTNLSVFLGYGWLSPDGPDTPPELYEKNALSIAREVCECLRNQQFEVDWNGSFDRKIGISLNWQRRTMLE